MSLGSAQKQEPRFRLWSLADMRQLPPREWVVDRVIEEGTLALLYGPPANMKSFLAIDLALSVTTGRDWNGRKVKPGAVVYVAGEGDRGIQRRADAWLQYHAVQEERPFFLVRQAPQLRNGIHVPELLVQFDHANVKPRLIVIDTLNRSFVGGDENSAQQMGEFVKGVGDLQLATDATVLVLHHTPKHGSDPRGSGALHGAADAMISVKREGEVITVENTKQKDEDEFESIRLRKQVVRLNVPGEVTSVVLVPPTEADIGGTFEKAMLGAGPNAALRILAAASDPLRTSEWRVATGALMGKEIADKTFDNWRSKLVDAKFVEVIDGTPAQYRISEKGAMVIGVPMARQSGSAPHASHATTP